jgi:hypothetical protein
MIWNLSSLGLSPSLSEWENIWGAAAFRARPRAASLEACALPADIRGSPAENNEPSHGRGFASKQ